MKEINQKKLLEEIALLKAHASEALKIADRLTAILSPDPDSTRARKKRLQEEDDARFLARKNKKLNQYQIRK